MNWNNDRDNSSGGESRVRVSVNRDVTPIKIGNKFKWILVYHLIKKLILLI